MKYKITFCRPSPNKLTIIHFNYQIYYFLILFLDVCDDNFVTTRLDDYRQKIPESRVYCEDIQTFT